jgi:hypothetical protein
MRCPAIERRISGVTSTDTTAAGETGDRSTLIYTSFLELLNRQDLDAATRCVNVERYRENCVRSFL